MPPCRIGPKAINPRGLGGLVPQNQPQTTSNLLIKFLLLAPCDTRHEFPEFSGTIFRNPQKLIVNNGGIGYLLVNSFLVSTTSIYPNCLYF